MKLLHLNIS